MPNPEHVETLSQGPIAWNSWREDNSTIKPHLSGANLSKANLFRANLSGAHLSGANLFGANLSEADLSGANLSEADLSGAHLSGADLIIANLREANLWRANLSGAVLSGANLSRAQLYETIFGDTDLREAKGLDSCNHQGPNVIDHRTLARSPDLPIAFLRGCGLPDLLIDYLPSLFHRALEFYSCFISYSTMDQDFADRLHADLQDKGVRCWFAPHDLQGGEKIHDQIDQAIRVYDRLLLILSAHSMNSEWVKTEIAHARQKEVSTSRQVLFPVRLVEFKALRQWKLPDGDTGKDSAREIREYFIPDFSNWKDHDSYQKAFQRLLKDLSAEAKNPPPDVK